MLPRPRERDEVCGGLGGDVDDDGCLESARGRRHVGVVVSMVLICVSGYGGIVASCLVTFPAETVTGRVCGSDHEALADMAVSVACNTGAQLCPVGAAGEILASDS